MDISSINLIAVLVAAVAAFVVGAVYYILLDKVWMAAAKIDPATAGVHIPTLLITFVAELLMALVLSLAIGTVTFGDITLESGLFWSFLMWLGFILTTLLINHRNQGQSWSLTLIDGLHWLLALLAMGAVIGWFGPPTTSLV